MDKILSDTILDSIAKTNGYKGARGMLLGANVGEAVEDALKAKGIKLPN